MLGLKEKQTRVRLAQPRCTDSTSHQIGEIILVGQAEAERMIAKGQAVPVEEPPPAAPTPKA